MHKFTRKALGLLLMVIILNIWMQEFNSHADRLANEAVALAGTLNSILTNDFQKERKNFVVTIILLLGPGNPEQTQQIQRDSRENGKTVK